MKPRSPRHTAAAGPASAPPAAEPAVGGTVTLAMVARAAGVSPSTVSRILNGTASVTPDKAAAVQEAIRTLGFRPNPVARGLAGGRTYSIGVLTQTISSPFYGEALLGIEDVLERAGYIPLFVSGHWSADEERKALQALLSRRVDGLIVLAGRLPDAELHEVSAQVATVVVGRRVAAPQLFSLCFDNHEGSRLATQHLIDLGHRRIACIVGDTAHEDALERLAGYRDALAAAGIAHDAALEMPGDYTETGGLLAVGRLLDSRVPFTGIVASNDQTAIGALLGLYRRNLRVPDDVSVVGFDDVVPARFSIPPLSTVRQSVYEAGETAARAVLELLDGRQPQGELPAPTLTPRESTRRLLR